MGVEEDFLKDNLDDGYDLENETQQPDNRADTKTRPTSRVLLSYQQAFSLNALNMFGTGHMAALPSTQLSPLPSRSKKGAVVVSQVRKRE